MNYLRDNRTKEKSFTKYGAIFLCLLVLILFRTPIYNGLSRFANFVFRPVLGAGNSVGNGAVNAGGLLVSKKTLIAENEELKRELADMSAKMANYDTLLNENETLKEILGRKGEARKLTLAGILSKPPKSIYDTLLIDAGSQDGVIEGALVFASGDVPIGRVAEVSARSSKVILFTTPGEITEGVVVPGGTFVEMIGRGGGNFEVILPRDFIFDKGIQVVLPGARPYVFGIAETVISDPRDSFKKGILVSPVNIQELKFVQVEQ